MADSTLIIILVFVVVLTLIFRKPIQERLTSLSFGKLKFGFGETSPRPDKALPNGEEPVFTRDDIQDEFSKIRGIGLADMDTQIGTIYRELRQNGIKTKTQLHKLATSTETIEELKVLYEEVFHRIPDANAVGRWGPILFLSSVSDASVREVRRGLRDSDEYKKAHPK